MICKQVPVHPSLHQKIPDIYFSCCLSLPTGTSLNTLFVCLFYIYNIHCIVNFSTHLLLLLFVNFVLCYLVLWPPSLKQTATTTTIPENKGTYPETLNSPLIQGIPALMIHLPTLLSVIYAGTYKVQRNATWLTMFILSYVGKLQMIIWKPFCKILILNERGTNKLNYIVSIKWKSSLWKGTCINFYYIIVEN